LDQPKLRGRVVSHFDFAGDLTLDEGRRRAAVLAAIGDDWDPIAVLEQEELAYDMLYSGLDDPQQRVYDGLVEAGVLPRREAGGAADGSDRRPVPPRLAGLPGVRPRTGLRGVSGPPQLPGPLAVSAEQSGRCGAPAVPALRPSVVDRHPPFGSPGGLKPRQAVGSRTTWTKNSSIWRTALMNWSRSTGLVT